KVVYDARESAKPSPMWQLCNAEMIQTIPGLVLAFFEAVVLAAISIAISTRLGMLPNLIIISSIYILGHLMPPLVQSSVGSFPVVAFMGQLIATILPVLNHFDVQAAVAGGRHVPWDYVGFAFLYAVIYCAIAMLAALALFEDRDVA
ncbi:MAG: ABC transporter permease, partial [Pirellulales bacterium]|nr:ABC transporter permease [Pirellulales bacterium]